MKLTDQDIVNIRKRRRQCESIESLMAEFGVGKTRIWEICKGIKLNPHRLSKHENQTDPVYERRLKRWDAGRAVV